MHRFPQVLNTILTHPCKYLNRKLRSWRKRQMEFLFAEKDLEIREAARRFADEEVAPVARMMDQEERFERRLIQRLAELGLLGATIPKEYGGSGLSFLSAVLIFEQLGRACSSTRGFLSVHLGLHSMCILEWGTEDQRRRYLPLLAQGKLVGCYALTEPQAGSDAANIQTTYRRDGDYYILNGMKHWISNSMIADQAIVFATSDPTLRHKGITAFIVPLDAPGVRRERMTAKQLGHRAADHARLYFEECRIPVENRLGEEGQGFKVAMSALDNGRLTVAAGAVGIATASLEASIKFARERVQFGQPIGQFQMIQSALADMAAETQAARLLTYTAAILRDRGQRATLETSLAKFYACEVAVKAADRAVLIHGGYGYNNDYPVERYLRDAKGLQIYEGTAHIQRIIIARSLLKEA
jgi:glutaryl-CoA dehydrogenase (non-decarboxylating)